jgi:hypothetical protein
VVRALARGRFHGVVRVQVDGEVVYDQAQRPKDVRGTIDLLTEASHRRTNCDEVEIVAVDDQFEDTRAVVTLRRELKKGMHTLRIRFEGNVPEDDFQKLLGFLRERLNTTFRYSTA